MAIKKMAVKRARKKTAKAIEEPVEERKKTTANQKELVWIFGFMIGVLVIFLVAYYIFYSVNNFEYKGLQFSREKMGNMIIYHHSYLIQSNSGQLYQYNMYLRNDPRRNDVPVVEGITYYNEKSPVYISISKTLEGCNYSAVGVATLVDFIAGNQFTPKMSVPEKDIADANNLTYATCATNPDDVTILIQTSAQTEITRSGNCYTISIANCDVMKAIEKFETQTVIDARNRALALAAAASKKQ